MLSVDAFASSLNNIQSASSAQVDALLRFVKLRVALEETYSASLVKLSKQLVLDEKSSSPALHAALSGMREDVLNEAAQHAQLAQSLAVDVQEPWSRWVTFCWVMEVVFPATLHSPRPPPPFPLPG